MNNNIWENLTVWHKIRRLLFVVVYAVSIVMLIVGVPLLIAGLIARSTFNDFDRIGFAIMTGFGIVVFPLSILWKNIELKGWKIKYLIIGKKFKTQFNELLTHYGNFPEEVKELKKTCKENYHIHGKLFSNENSPLWQYRVREGVKYALTLVTALNDCVKSKVGFAEFIAKCDNEDFTQLEKMHDYEIPMSPFEILTLLTSDIFDGGLEFLFTRVFVLCNFSLYDNGLSERFSEHNAEIKKKLDEVYSQILFTYETEIENALQRIKSLQADK